jgi:hypothetical protein
MKFGILTILSSLLFACNGNSQTNEVGEKICNNQELLLNSTNNNPILEFEMSWSYDSLKLVADSLYKSDLCQTCGNVPFNISFQRDERPINLEIEMAFNHMCCKNCPTPMELGSEMFSIMLNSRNQIMAESHIVKLDSLGAQITKYLEQKTHQELLFRIQWQEGTSKQFFYNVLNAICDSYVAEIENRNQSQICAIGIEEIKSTRHQFPLIIVFANCPLGIITIIDDIEIKNPEE